MATQQPSADTLITVKVLVDGTNRRFKLALRDLGAHSLPQKLRLLLAIPPQCEVQFERFSDSAGNYVVLDSTNPAVYKQLYRAAKAKLKLRLKAVIISPSQVAKDQTVAAEPTVTPRDQRPNNAGPQTSSFLETVHAHLPPMENSAPVSSTAQSIPCSFPEANEMPALRTYPAAPHPASNLSRPTLPTLNDFSHSTFSIDCNYCGDTVPNEHYHCSICEKGDFDLCQACVDRGLTCPGDGHWLIKRNLKNGKVIPSVTEILPPKSAQKDKLAPTQVSVSAVSQDDEERTCNGCISQLPASSFVTCKDCPDFDLCYQCFRQSEHGHHPAHVFQPVDAQSIHITAAVKKLLGAGRGLQHDAYCDGCDQQVMGIRHKCLSCPDFDFCSTCVKNAAMIHPGHRFAPIYEQLSAVPNYLRKELHRGIYCDGPLCASRAHKAYIRGDRYKCSICDDFDLCANCEAFPHLLHNKTHPLIKIKTAIRHVSIATTHRPDESSAAVQMGDRPAAKHASTETTRATSSNAATQVHTLAEVKPVEEVASVTSTTQESKTPTPNDLQAWYESDSTPDGTTVEPDHYISQSWTLRNPGPQAWPAGCAVYYIGGDDMRNLDMKHPSSVSSLTAANQSNVLAEQLEAGKTAVFTVLLRSPLRQGRAISYWRLKTPDGHPFGHKLWVDINVAAKPVVAASAPVPLPEPFVVEAESTSQQSSTMIFPTLEKESLESSIHEAGRAPSVVTAIAEPLTTVEDDLIEDLESLDLVDEDDNEEEAAESENGFLTDEEYDILDADDEDFLEEAQRVVAHQK